MSPFTYQRAGDVGTAVRLVAGDPAAQFIAAGTSQVDLMKEGVQRPSTLIDIDRLPLAEVTRTAAGGIRSERWSATPWPPTIPSSWGRTTG